MAVQKQSARRLMFELQCVILVNCVNMIHILNNHIKDRDEQSSFMSKQVSWFNIPFLDIPKDSTSRHKVIDATITHELNVALIADILCAWIDLWNNNIDIFFQAHQQATYDKMLKTIYNQVLEEFFEQLSTLMNSTYHGLIDTQIQQHLGNSKK